MILCIGVLCVAVLVPVVGRKKVSSEVRRAAVVMILVSALAILAQISEEMESGGIELELVRRLRKFTLGNNSVESPRCTDKV